MVGLCVQAPSATNNNLMTILSSGCFFGETTKRVLMRDLIQDREEMRLQKMKSQQSKRDETQKSIKFPSNILDET